MGQVVLEVLPDLGDRRGATERLPGNRRTVPEEAAARPVIRQRGRPDDPSGAQRDIPRLVELSGQETGAAPHPERLPLAREALEAVVAELADQQRPPGLEVDVVGIPQGRLPRPGPRRPEGPVRTEDLDPRFMPMFLLAGQE
mgnify:CR=1 FL=1